LKLKKRIIKRLVWSVALYVAETWMLTQADRSRLEDFEMWLWRRMEKISWKEKKKFYTWSKVEDRKILNTIWYQKHRWMGHVLWHDGILRAILEGRMLGRSTKGGRRCRLRFRFRRLIRNKELCRSEESRQR